MQWTCLHSTALRQDAHAPVGRLCSKRGPTTMACQGRCESAVLHTCRRLPDTKTSEQEPLYKPFPTDNFSLQYIDALPDLVFTLHEQV